MRAVVITAPGCPEVLRIEERPTPEPGSSQVRVRVRASALNRADLLQRRGSYPPPPGAPADILGLEYAGEVDMLGSGTTLHSIGDRVMGIVGGGGHAEFLCVHEREAISIPPNLNWSQAAAIPEAFLTAHDALRQLGVRLGERLMIHAVASGVGTAALQLARATGAVTIGTSRSPEKLDRARALGLDYPIDSSRPDWAQDVEAITGRDGIDAVLDLVGGSYLAENLRLLAVRGRAIVVGTVGGSHARLDLGLLLRKRLRLTGTVLRSRPIEEKIAVARDFSATVLPLLASGRLRPVIDRAVSFDDVVIAHRAMENSETFGKITLEW